MTDSPPAPQAHTEHMRGAPILEVRDLRVSIVSKGSRFEVVRGTSLRIHENEIVCLVGESGCGKSMTALSVMGLLPRGIAQITGGSIAFEEQNLLDLSERELRRLRSDSIYIMFEDAIT